MKKSLLIFSIFLFTAGGLVTWLCIERLMLPYNKEGRYFDTIDDVSYDEQAILVYCFIAIILIIMGVLAFWWSRKTQKK